MRYIIDGALVLMVVIFIIGLTFVATNYEFNVMTILIITWLVVFLLLAWISSLIDNNILEKDCKFVYISGKRYVVIRNGGHTDLYTSNVVMAKEAKYFGKVVTTVDRIFLFTVPFDVFDPKYSREQMKSLLESEYLVYKERKVRLQEIHENKIV